MCALTTEEAYQNGKNLRQMFARNDLLHEKCFSIASNDGLGFFTEVNEASASC
jgi:hypothetical protein